MTNELRRQRLEAMLTDLSADPHFAFTEQELRAIMGLDDIARCLAAQREREYDVHTAVTEAGGVNGLKERFPALAEYFGRTSGAKELERTRSKLCKTLRRQIASLEGDLARHLDVMAQAFDSAILSWQALSDVEKRAFPPSTFRNAASLPITAQPAMLLFPDRPTPPNEAQQTVLRQLLDLND